MSPRRRVLHKLGLAFAAIGLLSCQSMARSSEPRHFVVISNGEVVGELKVLRDGQRLTVDYQVDDNGRGPRTHEVLDLGTEGLPRRWRISGSGETGVDIRESFDRTADGASWRTSNDRGSVRIGHDDRSLYLARGASPFAYAMYAEALLGAPQHSLPALPSGSLRAERVATESAAKPEVARSASVWALWGLGTSPVLVLVGASGEFLGVLDTNRLIIPDGWRNRQGELVSYAARLDRSLLIELSKKHVHRWEGPVHLKNVRVLDPVTGALSHPQTVVTFRDRITEVVNDETSIPQDAVVFDGEGGVVMPSLFDMHAHLSAWDSPLYLAAGITIVRDLGNDNGQLLALTSEIESGRVMGPGVVAAGFLEGRSPFSARGGFIVDSLPEALKGVRWYAERGYWQIKLYNSLDPDWLKPVAQEAHRLGMRVAGHVPAFTSSGRAIRDGYDEITHLNQLLLSLMIDTSTDDTRTPFRFTALGERTAALDLSGKPFQSLVALMKEHHTVLDPTAAILSQMLLARGGEITPADAPWIDHVPAPVQRTRKSAILKIARSEDARYRQSEKRLLEALRAIHEAGIRIVPGTDDTPGFMLQSELETWQRAGIEPREVLRLATIECARYLGLDSQSGTIERGKRADIILVGADPTRDIHALRQLRLVMKDGAVIFPEEVYAEMQIKPFASKPPLLHRPRTDSAAPSF